MDLRSSEPVSAQRRVLVVDDALTVRLYYRQILEKAGFEVIEAGNGLEGLEKIAQTQPDLVVVDVNMPKMDGYTMLRAVRSDAATQSVPAIMISTEAERGDALRGYEAGANLYLVKPVRPDMLRSFVSLMTGTALA